MPTRLSGVVLVTVPRHPSKCPRRAIHPQDGLLATNHSLDTIFSSPCFVYTHGRGGRSATGGRHSSFPRLGRDAAGLQLPYRPLPDGRPAVPPQTQAHRPQPHPGPAPRARPLRLPISQAHGPSHNIVLAQTTLCLPVSNAPCLTLRGVRSDNTRVSIEVPSVRPTDDTVQRAACKPRKSRSGCLTRRSCRLRPR